MGDIPTDEKESPEDDLETFLSNDPLVGRGPRPLRIFNADPEASGCSCRSW